MLKFRFTSFTASDGSAVTIPDSGVVVFVGPNNSGKSQALKDLLGHARNQSYLGRTIVHVETERHGDLDEAHDWATEHFQSVSREGIARIMVPGWGEVTARDFAVAWAQPGPLGPLTDATLLYADGATRLTAGNAQPNFDVRNEAPIHPIQRAYREPSLERDFSNVSESAFGLELAVDRFAGSFVGLRLGERPEFDHNGGVPTQQYLDQLTQMPQLEEQGDGVKSFIGLMSQLIAGDHEGIFVDEPEAFLHPPQARLLGRMLAQRATGQQVFLATHSAAILEGVLDSGASVTIIRLTREGTTNRAAVLDDVALKELWADPLLRYSNVLEGLFYDAVVLCEGDADCRYYSAVRDRLQRDEGSTSRRPELLFAQCGGKSRIPVVVRAVRAVQVPVVVVADFDILRDEKDVAGACSALGIDWSTHSGQRSRLAAALTADAKPLRKTAVSDALQERLSEAGEVLSARDVSDLRTILRIETGWDKVKRAGLGAVPQGDAYAAAEQLVEGLRSEGMLVVPVGELERFVPSVPGHGPTWVNEVLSRGLHESPSPEAASFVEALDNVARAKAGRK